MKIVVQGPYACFSDPAHKSARTTYHVPTPSAMVGLIESIYWHPGIRYKINSITVCNPIKLNSFTTNELNQEPSAKIQKKKLIVNSVSITPLSDATHFGRTQRTNTVLLDVKYIIDFDIQIIDTDQDIVKKTLAILGKRINKGKYYKVPYLGLREYTAQVRFPTDDDKPIDKSEDFGLMLHHIEFGKENKPVFYRAKMQNGVIKC